MTQTINHVSFDLDGTLVDSFDVMRQSWEAATRELGINCGFERYRGYVGLPFAQILQNIGLSDYRAELSELYFKGTRARQGQITVIAGATALLQDLRQRGLSLSIITSKPRANAEPLLQEMRLDVDMLICADDVPRGKPDPLAATLVCERFAVAPAEVLYVGDMVFDLQFALNARMPFLFFENEGRNRLPANLRNPVRRVPALSAITAEFLAEW
jgi:HAD superfamily hydrolase (TIGR01549 family)